MAGHTDTDLDSLSRLAAELRQAADGMSGAPSSPPNAPNAGESTGAVAAMLESLTQSAAALTETASKAGDDVDASRATYGENDHHATSQFNNIN